MIESLEQLGWLANLAELTGFLFLIWALFNTHILRKEQRQANKRITLLLEVENQPDKSYALPGIIRRKDFSRAEIMGRLGMIPLKDESKRFFSIGYVKNPKFLQEIEQIYNSAKDDVIMTIRCTLEEFEQFDFS